MNMVATELSSICELGIRYYDYLETASPFAKPMFRAAAILSAIEGG